MAQQSSNGNRPRLSEKGLLTPDNCVVALIDHQGQMLFGTSNFDRQGSSTTPWHSEKPQGYRCTCGFDNGRDEVLQRNMWPQLRAVFPGQEPIERSSMNSWDDKNFVAAIEKADARRFSLPALDGNLCCASDGPGDS